MNRGDELTQWLNRRRKATGWPSPPYIARPGKLYGTILRILGDRALAADIFQEVFT